MLQHELHVAEGLHQGHHLGQGGEGGVVVVVVEVEVVVVVMVPTITGYLELQLVGGGEEIPHLVIR